VYLIEEFNGKGDELRDVGLVCDPGEPEQCGESVYVNKGQWRVVKREWRGPDIDS
jgi:hypothetical protein